MDFFLLWEQVLDYINKNDSQYYQMFSYNVFPTSMTDTTLVITPNKPYLVRWINGVYREKLEQIVSRIAGKPMKVEVAPPPDSTAPSPQMPVPPAQKEAAAPRRLPFLCRRMKSLFRHRFRSPFRKHRQRTPSRRKWRRPISPASNRKQRTR